MKAKLKSIVKILLYLALVSLSVYLFILIPTNIVLVVMSGGLVALFLYLRERFKKLERNQEALAKLVDKGVEHLANNQKELQAEIRRSE